MRTNPFVKAMQEFANSKSFMTFLAKEEGRLEIAFYGIGKMPEESRLIQYFNYMVRHKSVRPKGLDESFFQTWKTYSGYMPFEGTQGPVPGKPANMQMLVGGIEFAAKQLGFEVDTSGLTQESWDESFRYWDERLFGKADETSSDCPF